MHVAGQGAFRVTSMRWTTPDGHGNDLYAASSIKPWFLQASETVGAAQAPPATTPAESVPAGRSSGPAKYRWQRSGQGLRTRDKAQGAQAAITQPAP